MERKEQLEGRTRELAVAAGRAARHRAPDAVAARQDDRAPLGRGRALFAGDRPRAGPSEREQDVVHTAALLHDIGKFIFPDSILFADTKLSPADLEIVRRHPEQGARLVARIDGYGPVAEIILAHHERIDGNGYPNGLVGEQIPLAARIISVADTYDVMTSRDSYRQPGLVTRGDRGAAARLEQAARRRRRRDVHRAAREAVRHVPARGRRGLRARAQPGAARPRLRRSARRGRVTGRLSDSAARRACR